VPLGWLVASRLRALNGKRAGAAHAA